MREQTREKHHALGVRLLEVHQDARLRLDLVEPQNDSQLHVRGDRRHGYDARVAARLDYDEVTVDRYGRDLAAPIVTGADGADYNISMVMVYVGLAKWAYYGDNQKYLDWAKAAQTWAKTAQWNMWAPGGPFNGATNCG